LSIFLLDSEILGQQHTKERYTLSTLCKIGLKDIEIHVVVYQADDTYIFLVITCILVIQIVGQQRTKEVVFFKLISPYSSLKQVHTFLFFKLKWTWSQEVTGLTSVSDFDIAHWIT